jgi:hypothetical protein
VTDSIFVFDFNGTDLTYTVFQERSPSCPRTSLSIAVFSFWLALLVFSPTIRQIANNVNSRFMTPIVNCGALEAYYCTQAGSRFIFHFLVYFRFSSLTGRMLKSTFLRHIAINLDRDQTRTCPINLAHLFLAPELLGSHWSLRSYNNCKSSIIQKIISEDNGVTV